jgi:hypothetical protein
MKFISKAKIQVAKHLCDLLSKVALILLLQEVPVYKPILEKGEKLLNFKQNGTFYIRWELIR